MKIMLTSFGIEHSLSNEEWHRTVFDRMPPVSLRRVDKMLIPDYEVLLLCDCVIMDSPSFDWLVRESHPVYAHVAETLQAMRSEGRIELVDFSSILAGQKELLDQMIEHDLKVLDMWVEPLREARAIWDRFSETTAHLWDHTTLDPAEIHFVDVAMSRVTHIHSANHQMLVNDDSAVPRLSALLLEALKSAEKRKRKEFRGPLRETLRVYLAYVNANLILSRQLGVPFYDWLDFKPFYSAKFLFLGEGDPVEEKRQMLEELFTVSFPEYSVQDTRAFIRAMNDKRLGDLRQLVAQAVAGEVTFDRDFAKRVLMDVVKGSARIKKWRNVVGYATLPIGFLPWVGTPVQKVLEEGVGAAIEQRFTRERRWFYMLSDLAGS